MIPASPAKVWYTDFRTGIYGESLPHKLSRLARTAGMDKIDMASQHLLSLINDILEMSRIENGKMELEPVTTDLRATMDEVRDLFANQMESKKIRYKIAAEEVTDGKVLCDKKRLDRVILNLISNAVKFTPAGGEISVILRQQGIEEIPQEDETLKAYGSYELRVKDTGIGMSEEFAQKVFEAYTRDNGASEIQGTGLGMAITKSIVDLMGGTIEVKSKLNHGTEFIIDLKFPIEA